jgi:hypothetical protein
VPTTLWYPGQIFVDEHQIGIPVDALPGRYQLHAGMYDPKTVERLSVQQGEDPLGGSIIIAEFDVEELP